MSILPRWSRSENGLGLGIKIWGEGGAPRQSTNCGERGAKRSEHAQDRPGRFLDVRSQRAHVRREEGPRRQSTNCRERDAQRSEYAQDRPGRFLDVRSQRPQVRREGWLVKESRGNAQGNVCALTVRRYSGCYFWYR